MKHVVGVPLGVLALILQCGCSQSSNPSAPVIDPGGISAATSADEPFPADQPGRPHVFIAGVDDDFAAPSEPSAPSAVLLEFVGPFWPQDASRNFDEVGVDQALIHTFTGWSFPVRHAMLELHLRADGGLSENDSVRLGLIGGPNTVEAFRWWMTIHKVTGTWQPGQETTLRLNLEHLPQYHTFPTDILSELQDGSFELLVEDDTSIDYARLVLIPDRRGARPVALQVPLRSSGR